MTSPVDTQNEWDTLSQLMQSDYSLNELKALSLKLRVNYEELGEGIGLSLRVNRLILWVERNGQLNNLLSILQKERPLTPWPTKFSSPIHIQDKNPASPTSNVTNVGGNFIGAIGPNSRTTIRNIEIIQGNQIKLSYDKDSEIKMDANDPFLDVYLQIESLPNGRKKAFKEIQQIHQEINKGEAKTSELFLHRSLQNLIRIAPKIFELTLAILQNPAHHYSLLAQKTANNVKEAYLQGH